MTGLDPRAEWTGKDAPYVLAGRQHVTWGIGANDRLAALCPQLNAADALADDLRDAIDNGYGDQGTLAAYLAARDAWRAAR